MSEFCLPCWNRINEIALTESDVKLSRGEALCEGCGEWKRVIVGLSPAAREGQSSATEKDS